MTASWAVLGGGGCTRVSDQSRFEGPDAALEIVQTAPTPGALGVDPEIRIDLCMSGRIDPRSVGTVDATISSGGSVVDAELAVELIPWHAPGRDAPPDDLDAPWCEGSVLSVAPRTPLTAGVRHRLRMVPSAVGWAGEPMLTEGPLWLPNENGSPRYLLEFTIDPDPPSDPVMPPPPTEPTTLADLFAPGGPFDPQREICSCHRDPEDLALARLDLRDPEAAYAGLVDEGRLRDTGFPMVAPRDASQSFLVHKLLRDESDGEEDDAPLWGVLGDPMPPDEPLPYADVLAIVTWIEDGALP